MYVCVGGVLIVIQSDNLFSPQLPTESKPRWNYTDAEQFQAGLSLAPCGQQCRELLLLLKRPHLAVCTPFKQSSHLALRPLANTTRAHPWPNFEPTIPTSAFLAEILAAHSLYPSVIIIRSRRFQTHHLCYGGGLCAFIVGWSLEWARAVGA